MNLKFLVLSGLFVIFSGNAMYYTPDEMMERPARCVNDMKEYMNDQAASYQEEFLKERGGADVYFDNAKKPLYDLAVVLKEICELGCEISEKVSNISRYFLIECAFGILDDYYRSYKLYVESENDPRLLDYIDCLGDTACFDWKLDEMSQKIFALLDDAQ